MNTAYNIRFLASLGMTDWASNSRNNERLAKGETLIVPIPNKTNMSFRMERSGMRNL